MGWGPGPGKGGQKKPNHPHLWRSPQRTQKRKRKTFFFSISSRRRAESVDGLDSSLAQSAGDLWICKGRVKEVARAGLKGLDKTSHTLFLTHAHTNLQRWCKFFHQYNTFTPKTP